MFQSLTNIIEHLNILLFDWSVTKTVHLVPTLCVGMQAGRSASRSVCRKTVSDSRKQDAERP
ncbi:MAG: hypothetical protein GY749_50150, partial [Desulfobacteraceae bacterium]|nr:hypothetical protein [Desulfobacteraceae bacterium]